MGKLLATATNKHSSYTTSINVKKPRITDAFWCNSKGEKIDHAKILDTVYFKIITESQAKNTDIHLTLWDKRTLAGIDSLWVDSDSFDGDKKEIKEKIKNNELIIKLALPKKWENEIDSFTYAQYLNLYWKIENVATFENAEFLPAQKENTLMVTRASLEGIIIMASEHNEKFPQILDAETGSTIVVDLLEINTQTNQLPENTEKENSIKGDLIELTTDIVKTIASDKIGKAVEELGNKALNRFEYKAERYALTSLQEGKLVANNGKVYDTKKRVVDMKTKDKNGNTTTIKRARDFSQSFGSHGQQKITTKGIDQKSAFTSKYYGKYGKVVSFIETGKDIFRNTGSFIDIADMTLASANGKLPSLPMPTIGHPLLSPIINIFVQKVLDDYFGETIQDVNNRLQEEFEATKLEGQERIKQVVANPSLFIQNQGYKTINVNFEIASKILNGEYKTMDDVYENLISASEDIMILYREFTLPNMVKKTYLVETFYIKSTYEEDIYFSDSNSGN